MSTINRVADFTNGIHRDILLFFRFGVNILNRCVHGFYYAERMWWDLFPMENKLSDFTIWFFFFD